MGNPSNCNWEAAKRRDAINAKIGADFTRMERTKPSEFSPDEIAALVERWRKQHDREMVLCPFAQETTVIDRHACVSYRKGPHGWKCDDCTGAKGIEAGKEKQRPKRSSLATKRKLLGLLTLQEAGDMIGMPWWKVRHACHSGQLKYRYSKPHKNSKQVLGIAPDDLREFARLNGYTFYERPLNQPNPEPGRRVPG